MMDQEKSEQIYEILKELQPRFDFRESTDFIEDGYLDSFDVVNLVSELEDAFGVIIDGRDVIPEHFSSVDKIIALIDRSEKME